MATAPSPSPSARGQVSGPALRASWFEGSLERGSRDLAGWRTPGVDATVSALVGPSVTEAGLERALRMLAWERAAEAAQLDILLGDIEALWAVLTSSGMAPIAQDRARQIAIDGWVDAVAAERGVPCIDPLSGLHTAGYLHGRIYELDRVGGPDDQPSLVMVVIRWHEPHGPWLRIATMLQVADALRAIVRPEATICQDGAHTAVALVPDDGKARTERLALQRRLDAEPLSSSSRTIDLVPVPEQREHLRELLRSLRTMPSEPATPRPAQLRMRTSE